MRWNRKITSSLPGPQFPGSSCLSLQLWLAVVPRISEVFTPGVARRLSGYVCTRWRCRVECSFCGDAVDCKFQSIPHGNKSNNTGSTNTEHNAHPFSEPGRALASFKVGRLSTAGPIKFLCSQSFFLLNMFQSSSESHPCLLITSFL